MYDAIVASNNDVYTVAWKNGTTSILDITLTKFKKIFVISGTVYFDI